VVRRHSQLKVGPERGEWVAANEDELSELMHLITAALSLLVFHVGVHFPRPGVTHQLRGVNLDGALVGRAVPLSLELAVLHVCRSEKGEVRAQRTRARFGQLLHEETSKGVARAGKGQGHGHPVPSRVPFFVRQELIFFRIDCCTVGSSRDQELDFAAAERPPGSKKPMLQHNSAGSCSTRSLVIPGGTEGRVAE
jgi:hypothetical protein